MTAEVQNLDDLIDDGEDEEDEPKICDDCGEDTAPCKAAAWDPCPEDCDHTGRWEWYMLRDQIWAQIGDPTVACIGCAEKRLGRPLNATDFSNFPINDPRPCDTPRLTAARARKATDEGTSPTP